MGTKHRIGTDTVNNYMCALTSTKKTLKEKFNEIKKETVFSPIFDVDERIGMTIDFVPDVSP